MYKNYFEIYKKIWPVTKGSNTKIIFKINNKDEDMT